MKQTIFYLLFSLVTALLTPASSPGVTAHAIEAPTSCDWDAEYQGALRDLDEDPDDWIVVDWVDGGERWGKAYPNGMAAISPDVPCDVVQDGVRHEWMHLQQLRAYGTDFGASVLGRNRVEIVADCGSQLLGSRYTPYADTRPCSERDLRDARALISKGGGR